MSLLEAVAAATGVAAEAAGIAQTVGTLAPGKMADVLIVNADVTADVKALARVRAVFQAGALVAERMSSPWIC